MVPVRLELKNFLSYGTAAPALDFERFDVACLSGKNGQGKSALLDAMTWALFGEARKSGGKRKPDEEIIRIGTHYMKVGFTFDLEATRYRIERDFSVSASGKTTKPGLEFQLYDPDADAFRPLTASTMRATQGLIETTLGLDYDTFINSAFLLQGRSDEFTKKSASERKDILARILNLGRYEDLRAKASEAWRDAKRRAGQADTEIDRLQAALEDADAWKEEKAAVEADVAARREALTDLRAKAERLATRQASLETKARERDEMGRRLDALAQRRRDLAAERDALAAKIERADALLAQRDAIQAASARRERLQAERDRLDTQRDMHRGLEKQLDRLTRQRDDKERELRHRLDKRETERGTYQSALNEAAATLAKRPDLERQRDRARRAQAARDRLATVRTKRDALTDEHTTLERDLTGRRAALDAEREQHRARLGVLQKALAGSADLDQRLDRLGAQVAEREALAVRHEATREEGTALRARVDALKGELKSQRAARAATEDELADFRDATDADVCPTCGTALTDAHRAQVTANFETTLAEQTRAVEDAEVRLTTLEAERQTLLATFQGQQRRLEALADAPAKLATAQAEAKTRAAHAEEQRRLEQQVAALTQQLDAKTYGAALRRARAAVRQKLDQLDFNPQHFEAAQREAAKLDGLRERLRTLDEVAGRRDELQRKLKQAETEIARLRELLDTGGAFGDLPDRIAQTRQQLEATGFDAARFAAVKRELETLADAAQRMAALASAQQNRADWQTQRARRAEQMAEAEAEAETLAARRAALAEALAARDDVEAALARTRTAVAEAETALTAQQTRLGQLTARLDQAAADRKALADARVDRSAAVHDRTVYAHLRTAFGKHGIPSLIIEETIPEIEQRANGLLDRLSDGMMRVRLETLADKKSGGTKETLDIVLTDEKGHTRPYETFSGGESFRVNFALRLALAQLLAERNGVRVRTLVIDEGFGTQDEDGIQRLVEAIQAVREDFAKVLVITHLDRLKRVFPVRIEVAKDPATGSSFDLVGA